MLVIDIEGLQLTDQERDMLQHPLLSGIIHFKKNYKSINQLKDLNHEIHEINPRLFICADQEGGRVQRFSDGFTQLPALRHWGQLYDQDPDQAIDNLADITTIMVEELQATGVDLTLAPVLDVDHGVSQVIGDRSFASEPKLVTLLAETMIDTMHRLGMPVTGKHFPGHGAVVADSHQELPVDTRSWETIKRFDLQPFVNLLSNLDAVMAAHVVYSELDELPASFSPFWLRGILREQMGFDGVIMSDDISMQGAATIGSYTDRTQKALEAGCDLVFLCNNQPAAFEVMGDIKEHHDAESEQRIEAFKQNVKRMAI